MDLTPLAPRPLLTTLCLPLTSSFSKLRCLGPPLSSLTLLLGEWLAQPCGQVSVHGPSAAFPVDPADAAAFPFSPRRISFL